MGNWGRCDIRELEKLRDQIEQVQRQNDRFCEECAKYLAQRLLAKVIKRTPVGGFRKMPNGTKAKIKGYSGGTLRRGWAALQGNIRVNHLGDTYVVELINPTEYASYVEYGHRTANHKGWVSGQFMLTISERELQAQAPAMLQKKLKDFIGRSLDV